MCDRCSNHIITVIILAFTHTSFEDIFPITTLLPLILLLLALAIEAFLCKSQLVYKGIWHKR